jgi:hypothetical protein
MVSLHPVVRKRLNVQNANQHGGIHSANCSGLSHLDFFVNRHNLAVEVYSRYRDNAPDNGLALPLSLPALVLHYEDYGTDYDATIRALLDFVQLPQVVPQGVPFQSGKSYVQEFFTKDQQQLVYQFIRDLASPEAWSILQRYFDVPVDNQDDDDDDSDDAPEDLPPAENVVAPPTDEDSSLLESLTFPPTEKKTPSRYPAITWLMSFPNSVGNSFRVCMKVPLAFRAQLVVFFVTGHFVYHYQCRTHEQPHDGVELRSRYSQLRGRSRRPESFRPLSTPAGFVPATPLRAHQDALRWLLR